MKVKDTFKLSISHIQAENREKSQKYGTYCAYACTSNRLCSVIVLMLVRAGINVCSSIVLMLVWAGINDNRLKITHKSNTVLKTLLNSSNSHQISWLWYQTIQNDVLLHEMLKSQNDLRGPIVPYACGLRVLYCLT